jgi:hypothetical protein
LRSKTLGGSNVASTGVALKNSGLLPNHESTESGVPGGLTETLHPLSSDITSTKDIVMFLLLVRRFGLDRAIAMLKELAHPLPRPLWLAIDAYGQANQPKGDCTPTPTR